MNELLIPKDYNELKTLIENEGESYTDGFMEVKAIILKETFMVRVEKSIVPCKPDMYLCMDENNQIFPLRRELFEKSFVVKK